MWFMVLMRCVCTRAWALEWHMGIKSMFLCVALGACLQSLWECLCKPVLVSE